jgi:hypothetical protein
MVTVLLLAGCVSGQIDKKNYTKLSSDSVTITPLPNQNQTLSDENDKAKLAAIAPILKYKKNMAEWQKKLPTDLLYVLDPDCPDIGNTREQIKSGWKCLDQLIPSENVTRLDIKYPKSPVGDYLHVQIKLIPNSSISVIEPYVATLKEAECRECYWVDMNQLQELASMKEVQTIDLIYPSVTAGSWYECRNGTMVLVYFGHEDSPLVVERSK